MFPKESKLSHECSVHTKKNVVRLLRDAQHCIEGFLIHIPVKADKKSCYSMWHVSKSMLQTICAGLSTKIESRAAIALLPTGDNM